MQKYKLKKSLLKAGYKGLIPSPQIQQYFIGRICDSERTPFPHMQLLTYLNYGYFQQQDGISQTSPEYLKRLNFPQEAASTIRTPTRAIPLVYSYQCNRCKTTNATHFIRFNCAKCEKQCLYCRHCINMGRIASCTKLLAWSGPVPRLLNTSKHQLTWGGELTALQNQASKELSESLLQKRSHLLHAVCGAGKTELLFRPIYEALQRGERVCIATPRTDVVLELFPRLKQAFENTMMHALYGGAQNPPQYVQLIIATTHQLYHFQNAFDLVIVDEADAFPYTSDKALQQAVQKAKKPNAPIAYVTATPSPHLLAKVKDENFGYSFIPKRFHNFPLPVPTFSALWNYDKQLQKGRIPKKLQIWIGQCIEQEKPFLVFFPTIELMERSLPLFQSIHSEIISVNADDPNRKQKVLQLREEKVPGLLTTTILERGITIKNVQVAVIGAESKIFNASALIQIAGRVGRNSHFPDGEILFYHHGVTVGMDDARRQIMMLNESGFPRETSGEAEG